jgi:hypothetical protein
MMNNTCLLCGSPAVAVTGLCISPAGTIEAVYHLCSCCWSMGQAAIAPMAEAALCGAQITLN